MQITYGAKTDVGFKRSHNEDSLCVDPELGLYVVCDGMGGHNAGEVASRLAVEVIQQHLWEGRKNPGLPIIGPGDDRFSAQTNRLASAIRLANQVIRGAAQSKPDQVGMGTTVVSAVITAHVGDSRLYLIRGRTIEPLTEDHSLVAEQIRRGLLTEEQAESSPQKNIVTRALGIEDQVEVDLDELPLMKDDALLLCSDGLTRGVKSAEILDVVRSETDPQAACGRLITLANQAGGDDNTTVILIVARQEPRTGFWQRIWRRLLN
jgi:protein phosphatase